jgi:transcriptional regulator with XRE-family HTH domain
VLVLKSYQIQRIRKARGITRGKIARECGVSLMAVHYWITGQNYPTPNHAAKLQKVLLGF